MIADIHGNLPALEAVQSDFSEGKVDAVINLGDCVSGPLWPAETAEILMKSGWFHVRGNHDRAVGTGVPSELGLSDSYAHGQLNDAQRQWLGSLPGQLVVGEILAIHGSPTSDDEFLLEVQEGTQRVLRSMKDLELKLADCIQALVLCGHSHLPRCVRLVPGTTLVNPGSVGLQAYEEGEPHPYHIDNGSPHARYAILERSGQSWIPSFRLVEYDWTSASRKAAKEGRNDWKVALETGYSAGRAGAGESGNPRLKGAMKSALGEENGNGFLE